MFLGHLAIGFASKRALPRESLPVLLAAPLFLDLLWPLFLATGLESVHIDPGNTAVTPLDLHDSPYSYSLLMAVVWSVVFGLAFFALRRDARAGVILGGSVFSHWLLDFLAHAPDSPASTWGSVFGPPPPNATAIIISDLAVLVFFAWAYAVDKRRVTLHASLAFRARSLGPPSSRPLIRHSWNRARPCNR
jgi:hypothetical protein